MLVAGHVLVTTPIYVSSADLDFQAPSSATRDIVRWLWLLVAALVPVALEGSLGAKMESTGPYEDLSAESLVPLALLASVSACALGVAFVAFMRQVRAREERTARSRAWLAVAVVAGTAFLVLAPIGRELGQRDRGIAMDRARNNRAPEKSPWSVTFHIVFGGWCILATGGGLALARSMPPGRAA